MKKIFVLFLAVTVHYYGYCWGFYAHKKINYYSVFLLPPGMLVLYKQHIGFLTEHATDPDKRRYAVPDEGARHFIDIDHYGTYPYGELPRRWKTAVEKYSEDSLKTYGIVPWYIQTMLLRLTNAFKEKNFSKIMKLSAEIGHYIADAHVPLHTNSNHNGQLTNQKGIHAFWESRVPELLADNEFDFFIGTAIYLKDPATYMWARILESAKEADSVLRFEKALTKEFPPDKKYSFEKRNNVVIRQYSSAYTIEFNKKLNGMIERRMRQSILTVASFWYTAWVNAGQPDLKELAKQDFSEEDQIEFDLLNKEWKNGKLKGREHDERPQP